MSRPKFNAGDVVYYKYPSRYSRSRDDETIEAIIQIVKVYYHTKYPIDQGEPYTEYEYIIQVIKVVRSHIPHFTNAPLFQSQQLPLMVEPLEIETYCRHLTPAERVLYS